MAIQNISSPIVFLGCYVKRFSASLGFNGSPTSYEVELVPGTGNSEDVSYGATGFQSGHANPGNISGFSFGRFNFLGIIQSWTENFGVQGRSFSVRLGDPRILLDNVPVAVGYGAVDSSLNYTNLWNYVADYSTPLEAGVTADGTLFRPLRDYIQVSGIVNAYGQPLKFNLGSGFIDGSGNNPSGIASWYRVRGNLFSVNQLLQQVASDHAFDYYVYINPNNFASGISGTIEVPTIKRTNTNASNEITQITSGYIASGMLISYSRGRELRTEPTTAIVSGPPQTMWCSFNNSLAGNKQVLQYWGLARDGSAIFSTDYNNKGLIALDHITGSGVAQLLSNSNFRIPYTKYTISRSFSSVYPPTMSIGSSAAEVTGYIADEEVLRAALYNQSSWEAMFFKKQSALATLMGINFQVFRDPSDYAQVLSTGLINAALKKVAPSGVGDRSPFTQAFLGAVYEATKSQAEEFYGKKYIALMDNGFHSVFNSNWLDFNKISADQIYPTIEYAPTSSASWQGAGPSGVDNHDLLTANNSSVFKDDVNKLKGFVSFINYNSNANSDFPYPIDMSTIPPEEILIEQGNKLVVPINATSYDLYPKYCIFDLPFTIQGITRGSLAASGNANRGAFYDFLLAMGYTHTNIAESGLLAKAGDNIEYGLAPPRPIIISSSAQNYGPHVPCEFKTKNFGPWMASGSRYGGVSLINDNTLAPYVFNTIPLYDTAGQQTAYKALANVDIIDSAEITVAGIPLYNLGDNIGDNSSITSMSLQFGVDGVTTTYSIRTFALPAIRTSKLLQDRITKINNSVLSITRELVDITDKLREFEIASERIFRPDQILDYTSNNKSSKKQNSGSSKGRSTIITTQRPTGPSNPSGRLS